MEHRNKPTFNVACGIILRRSRVLISERDAVSYYGGFWEFPGGKQISTEPLTECLRRELSEELGVRVAHIRLWRKVHYAYPDRNVRLHFFLCDIVSGEPRALGCAAVKWVHHRDLSQYRFPPPNRSIIEELQQSMPGETA